MSGAKHISETRIAETCDGDAPNRNQIDEVLKRTAQVSPVGKVFLVFPAEYGGPAGFDAREEAK